MRTISLIKTVKTYYHQMTVMFHSQNQQMVLRLGLIAILIIAIALPVYSQNTTSNSPESIFQYLQDQANEVLEVELAFDMAYLLDNRRQEEKADAVLTFKGQDKQPQKLNLGVQLRGKFRRQVCGFPPLMLKFKKKELKAMGLNDHNDIKLVTHCLEDRFAGNTNVFKEYLAYQLFNEVTDASFKVQLVRITYVDTEKNYMKTKRWGFIIEDTDEMAERLGGTECENCLAMSLDSLNHSNENLISLFQYMLGNEDWSSIMVRNIKIVDLPNDEKKIVPYDFDFSGFVNASYALPNSDFGLTAVVDRVFQGYQVSDETFWENIQLLQSKQKRFVEIIKDFKLLDGPSKKQVIAYLDTFFESIADVEMNKPESIFDQMRAKGGDFTGAAGRLIDMTNGEQ
ncbi:MAG: hypothetical protein AAFO07_08570 [Bacteroidota bacterium]